MRKLAKTSAVIFCVMLLIESAQACDESLELISICEFTLNKLKAKNKPLKNEQYDIAHIARYNGFNLTGVRLGITLNKDYDSELVLDNRRWHTCFIDPESRQVDEIVWDFDGQIEPEETKIYRWMNFQELEKNEVFVNEWRYRRTGDIWKLKGHNSFTLR
jgi:hypothetical protein